MSEPALAAQPLSLPVAPTPQPPGEPATLRAVPASPGGVPETRRSRLEIPNYALETALRLEQELGISHVLSQVLVRRGLRDSQSVRAFLEPGPLGDPAEFEGIDRAVDLIGRHVRSGNRITVHGDYDVDGICATALMVRALRALGADVDWYLPSRTEDGYGLSEKTVQRLAGRGTKLLVTVDCGITAAGEVGAALAGGLEVVVSDHHAPPADGALPACPIVHPAVCGYPCPDLCGTAVAFKLAQALGARTAIEDLELVALATVADLMPLVGENRRLVRDGLSALANTTKPGLRALMAVSSADPSALDTQVLGFRLAPRINAAGRLRRPDAGLELLLTDCNDRAQEIAAELDAVNGERRAVEQRIAWEAETQIAQLSGCKAFVIAGEDWHPGVIGIVASRIVERHHRPTILVAMDGELGTGSGRSIPGFDLLGALHCAAEHLERYGGHRAAAGLSVRRDRLESLREAIQGHAEELLTEELLHPFERVDAIVSGEELGLTLADELERLEPCGMGNAHVRLLVPGARFTDLRTMGEGRHARFSVISSGIRSKAVAFGCEGRLGADPGEPCDATFRLDRNVWNGTIEPRLVLRHAQPCSPEAIEVLDEPAGYLAAALAELDAPLLGRTERDAHADADGPHGRRTILDRRGESPLAVLADATAGGGPMLAVCADVGRRLGGLSARIGGFALTSHHALESDPSLASRYPQLVALDPPSGERAVEILGAGSGFTHLAWGEPELRFAQQIHEQEYGLRASLATLYRSLRQAGRVTGEELERLLRGDGPHGRPPRVAGKLVRVLVELQLVSLDRDLPALEVAGTAPTALERSPAYRVYAQRYEDGRRFLSSANLRPSD